jgi:basic amino acid/polyamine antiporter, APA family
MADEQLAFARRASGLVRGLSFWDVLSMGMAYITPIFAIWYSIQVGLFLYPKANLVLGIVISVLTVGWAGPLVWGILGSTMPRSGGDYVYTSRILTPWIAAAGSFAFLCGAFYWTIFNAVVFAVPSLAILGQYNGWTGFTDFVTSTAGSCLLSIVCLAIALLVVIFGQKLFKKLSILAIIVMTAGVAILNIAITFTSKSGFISNWDTQAAKTGSLGYHEFVAAAGTAAGAAMPTHWTWSESFGITGIVFTLFIWTFCIAYVGGEVKSPSKTLIKAHMAAWVIPVVLAIWTFLALSHAMDFDFLRAAAYQDFTAAAEGYTMPYSSSYMSLSYVASGASPLIAWTASITFMITMTWLNVVQFIVAQRILFAWGMDRMGPRWFTAVNAKWASPVGMYVLVAAISMFLVVGYWYLFPSVLAGLVASGMQLTSTFLLVAICAIILPFRKKVAHIWEASPFHGWKLLGIPVLTIAGVVYLAYILALLYFVFLDSNTRDITGRKAIVLVVAWVVGILWYLVWRARSKSQGVDVASLTYRELPPE